MKVGLLKIYLILALMVFHPRIGRAYETSLFDIELRSPYGKTTSLLKQMFGPPVQNNQADGNNYQTFKVSKNNHYLLVRASRDQKEVVGIQISGEKPFPNLDFVGQLNLGLLDSEIERHSGLPSMTRAGTGGYQVHTFPHSNFSIETKNGRIRSISIFVLGTEKVPADQLRVHCEFRHPLWREEDSYYTRAELDFQGHKKNVIALIDTAWDDVSITQDLCRKMGCKIFNPKTRQTGGGAISLGIKGVSQQNFFVDAPINRVPVTDVILGTGYLFARNLVLNLKHNYICLPKSEMGQIAQALALKKTSARIDTSGAWISAKFNNKQIPDVLIDTGSGETSLLMEHIRTLKLKKLGVLNRIWADTPYRAGVFQGPIQVEMEGSKRSLDKILEAPSAEIQRIGTQLLKDRIWGFDLQGQAVYFEP